MWFVKFWGVNLAAKYLSIATSFVNIHRSNSTGANKKFTSPVLAWSFLYVIRWRSSRTKIVIYRHFIVVVTTIYYTQTMTNKNTLLWPIMTFTQLWKIVVQSAVWWRPNNLCYWPTEALLKFSILSQIWWVQTDNFIKLQLKFYYYAWHM